MPVIATKTALKSFVASRTINTSITASKALKREIEPFLVMCHKAGGVRSPSAVKKRLKTAGILLNMSKKNILPG